MIFEIAGWAAFALYLLSHAYLSIFKSIHRPSYFAMNVAAAVLLTVSSVAISSWQAVLINVFWLVVSYAGLTDSSILQRIVPRLWRTLAPAAILTVTGAIVLLSDYARALDLLGWAGVWLFCGSYLLFTAQKVSRVSYLWMSLVAYALLLPIYFVQSHWPSFTLGVAWSAITIIGLVEAISSARRADAAADP
ncbi:MAG: hypothetical protein AAFV59_14960 [Pseudomonadota bacterium]